MVFKFKGMKKQAARKAPKIPAHIRQANDNIDKFNAKLAEHRAPKSTHDPVAGPWMKAETLAALPRLRHDFDMNRDPYIRLQLLDQGKTEAERREDQSGRGSAMVKKDKTTLRLSPPEEIRRPVDKQNFEQRWLAEAQKFLGDAVMSRVEPETRRSPQGRTQPAQKAVRHVKGPSR